MKKDDLNVTLKDNEATGGIDTLAFLLWVVQQTTCRTGDTKSSTSFTISGAAFEAHLYLFPFHSLAMLERDVNNTRLALASPRTLGLTPDPYAPPLEPRW